MRGAIIMNLSIIINSKKLSIMASHSYFHFKSTTTPLTQNKQHIYDIHTVKWKQTKSHLSGCHSLTHSLSLSLQRHWTMSSFFAHNNLIFICKDILRFLSWHVNVIFSWISNIFLYFLPPSVSSLSHSCWLYIIGNGANEIKKTKIWERSTAFSF
jgi:hypothetical protein